MLDTVLQYSQNSMLVSKFQSHTENNIVKK